MSNRKDYGPKGCCGGTAVGIALIAGVGLYSFKLMSNVSFRLTMKVLQMREKK